MVNLNDAKYNSEFITKEQLINRFSEYEIFKYYIGDFELGQTYNSPLRRGDEIPSFNIFYSKQHNCLLFKDFAGRRGDCIIFVMNLFGISSYNEAIQRVYKDLAGVTTTYSKLSKNIDLKAKETCKLEIVARTWEIRDMNYWKQFGISISTLEFYNVKPIYGYYHNSFYIDTPGLAYAYIEYKDDMLTFKIYRPYANKRKKWRNNHLYGVHSGYTQLPKKGNLLIITKSLKDVMALYENLRIPSIAIQSETCFIKDSVIDEYKTRFKKIFTLFDNDTQGIEQASSYINLYEIPSRFIPIKFNCKDFTDLIKMIGLPNAIEELKKLL